MERLRPVAVLSVDKKGGTWLCFEPTALACFEVDFVVDAFRRASAEKPFFR
jgi:hypothetical protein